MSGKEIQAETQNIKKEIDLAQQQAYNFLAQFLDDNDVISLNETAKLYYNDAMWLHEIGGYVNAKNIFFTAYVLNDCEEYAHAYIVNCIQAGDLRSAYLLCKELLETKPKLEYIIIIAHLLDVTNNPSALKYFDLAEKLAPASVKIKTAKAIHLMKSGIMNEGVALLLKAAILKPDCPVVKKNIELLNERNLIDGLEGICI